MLSTIKDRINQKFVLIVLPGKNYDFEVITTFSVLRVLKMCFFPDDYIHYFHLKKIIKNPTPDKPKISTNCYYYNPKSIPIFSQMRKAGH